MRAADIALKKCPYTPPPKKKKYPVTVMPCHTSSHVNTHTCAEYKYMCICVDTFAEYNTHTYTHTQTDRGGRGSRTCARIAPAHTVDAPCTQQCGPAAGAHGASRPAGAPRGPRTAHVCVCVCLCKLESTMHLGICARGTMHLGICARWFRALPRTSLLPWDGGLSHSRTCWLRGPSGRRNASHQASAGRRRRASPNQSLAYLSVRVRCARERAWPNGHARALQARGSGPSVRATRFQRHQ